MKILHVSNFYKPFWETGGVTRMSYELTTNLSKRGHEVTVYTTDGYKSKFEFETNKSVNIDGVNVYYFHNFCNSKLKKIRLKIPYYAPFILRKEIKNFDIIHIHEHRTILAVIVYLYAIKYGIPYTLQAHGSVLPFLQKKKLKKVFDFLFGYGILKKATKLIALNESEVLQYESMGVNRKNITIIPNGINLDEFNSRPSKTSFRNKYAIKNNEKIILYVGRIHKSKGLDLLINSFANLIKIDANLKLIFVGPDIGFRNELEVLISELNLNENIIFTGFIKKEEKIAAFINADVFVTPSFTGLPVSFLEACIFGLPIITTNSGDFLEWIPKVGYVVSYNSKELADAIYTVLNDNNLRLKFKKEGEKLIENEFSMDVFVKKIEMLYLECIS